MKDYSKYSDEELLEEWVKGDNDAGNSLSKKHFKKGIEYCLKYVARTSAEGLVQETFSKIFNFVENRGKVDCFRAYFYVILKNACINYLKKKSNVIERNSLEIKDVANLQSSNPHEKFEIKDLINYYVRQLNFAQQQVILLWGDGYSYQEIADRTNQTYQQAKGKIQRGLKNLKKFHKTNTENEK